MKSRRRSWNMGSMRRGLGRLGRGFAFGFSAALGAWVAIVLVSLLLMLVLRPWG